MVGVFRRSLSFPNKAPNRPPQKKPHLSHHIRSISLPTRSHPLISHIKNDINHLTNTFPQPLTSSSTLSQTLTTLKDIHATLQHILHLPHTQQSLRSHPLLVENLLEDFLRFADVYGIFQSSIFALKEELSSLQMSIRKRDDSRLILYRKAKHKMAKQMLNLVSRIRCGTTIANYARTVSFADAELVGVIGDVIAVTVSVSVALFNAIALSFASRKMTWQQIVLKLSTKETRVKKEGIEELLQQEGDFGMRNLKKKGIEEVRSVLKTMTDFENCICGIETVSQKVYRGLINSRVALLNTLSQ
ncbi:hypothetical protein SESBI_21206 [Sesbania bispinosa]|nr:hypothetical protein SESBI_21206 [Sesbania bispinosa]